MDQIETIYYNHGRLNTTLSSEGVTINAGEWAVVSVDVWSDKSIVVFVGSGRKNLRLPYYGSGYTSWFNKSN